MYIVFGGGQRPRRLRGAIIDRRMRINLGEYLDWSSSELLRVFGRKKDEEGVKDKIAAAVAASELFVAVGATRSMAAIFKIGGRDILKPFQSALKASQAVFDAKAPSSSTLQTTTSNALTRQLACKLSARVALTLLAPKIVVGGTREGEI